MQDPFSQSRRQQILSWNTGFLQVYTTVRNVGRHLFSTWGKLPARLDHHPPPWCRTPPFSPAALSNSLGSNLCRRPEGDNWMQWFLLKPLQNYQNLSYIVIGAGWWFGGGFFWCFLFFKEVISFTKGKYFFMQDIIKLEFIATGCCGCQKSR